VSMRARRRSACTARDPSNRPFPAAEYPWAVLSRTVHHHPYERSPTAAKLRGWYADVRTLADELRSYLPTRTRSGNPPV